MTWVPKDLLDGLERLHERYQRLLVTGWALDPHRADTRGVYREALALWPPAALARPARLTVLSVLLELEQLGVVGDIREAGAGFEVELVGVREVAAE